MSADLEDIVHYEREGGRERERERETHREALEWG